MRQTPRRRDDGGGVSERRPTPPRRWGLGTRGSVIRRSISSGSGPHPFQTQVPRSAVEARFRFMNAYRDARGSSRRCSRAQLMPKPIYSRSTIAPGRRESTLGFSPCGRAHAPTSSTRGSDHRPFAVHHLRAFPLLPRSTFYTTLPALPYRSPNLPLLLAAAAAAAANSLFMLVSYSRTGLHGACLLYVYPISTGQTRHGKERRRPSRFIKRRD